LVILPEYKLKRHKECHQGKKDFAVIAEGLHNQLIMILFLYNFSVLFAEGS
jgi:hypothetical protein